MRLLVVEDEGGIRDLLVQSLGEEGHSVLGVASAEEGIEAFLQERFDGFLLDLILPGMSGTDLCRWLRNQGEKKIIFMLTAKATASERVEGLDAGADDYITKPFDLGEVKARLRAFQRKAQGYPRSVMTIADLTVDPISRTARRGENDLGLSKREFDLLDYLLCNRDRLVTRSMIAQAVWNLEANLYTNVIDVFFNFLRKKVDGVHTPQLIHTVRGKGFILSEAKPAKTTKLMD